MPDPTPGGIPGQVMTKTGVGDYEQAWADPTGGGGGTGTASNTVTSETAYAQPPNPGSSLAYARGDHTHGTPTAPPAPVTLNPTALKTSNYTAAAGDVVRASTAAGTFTVTLPAAPADGTPVGVSLEVAGNPLTVSRGGSDTFATGNTTTRTLNNAGQTLLVVYEAAAACWVVEADPAPALTDGTYTTADASTPGQVKIQLNNEIGVTDLLFKDAGTKYVAVDYMTIAPLPACAYNNGAAGVGATLTGTANGALAAIDGMTPVAQDLVAVVVQAAEPQNGIYRVTQVGDAGTPFVLTRDINFDANTDWNFTVAAAVAQGTMHGGRVVRFRRPPGGHTMGTTAPVVLSEQSLADVTLGPVRNRKAVLEDFDGFQASQAGSTTAIHIAGLRGQLTGSGAGNQASQMDLTVAGGEISNGIMQVETGTTTTGYCQWVSAGTTVAFDGLNRWEYYIRFKVPVVSDATDTFNVKLGFLNNLTMAPTDGVYFEARQGTANWLAVCRAASTNTEVDTGNAYNTGFKGFSIIVPGNGHVYFCIGGVQVADISTNIPSATMYQGFGIIKSAGTASRTLRVDVLATDVPSAAGIWAP